jgi:hypothetical protein
MMDLQRDVPTQISTMSAAKLQKPDTEKIKKATSELRKTVEKYSDAVNTFLGARELVYDWSAVMLITFLEAFLEDGLVELAKKNPRLLRRIGPFDLKRVFEIESIEELRVEIRRQWAREVLRPDGPQTWSNLFVRLGATAFTKISRLGVQDLWDTRNLVVHAQGIASAAYVKKYPSSKLKVGAHISVSSSKFSVWISDVKDFVLPVEEFFSRYKTSASD